MDSVIRVISYNIHKGFDATNRNYVLGQIRDSIRQTNADLVFLQEVSGGKAISRDNTFQEIGEAQFEYLADGVWQHFAYGKNAVYENGHHGNAILSKFPIESFQNFDLSTNRFERRGMLHAKIRVSDSVFFNAFCLHLNLFEYSRNKQILRVINEISSRIDHKEPVVLAGDFNDWRQRCSAPLKDHLNLCEAFVEKHKEAAKTFPSFMPMVALDRIYYRGFDVLTAKVLGGGVWAKLSDHLALSSELKIKLSGS